MDKGLVLPMYNVHPYFPSKIGAKSAYYTWQNTAPSSQTVSTHERACKFQGSRQVCDSQVALQLVVSDCTPQALCPFRAGI